MTVIRIYSRKRKTVTKSKRFLLQLFAGKVKLLIVDRRPLAREEALEGAGPCQNFGAKVKRVGSPRQSSSLIATHYLTTYCYLPSPTNIYTINHGE